MKTINKLFIGIGLVGGLTSCSDFDEVNVDPSKTPIESTLPEYFLNSSMGRIQMNPDVAERIWVYNWADGARACADIGMLSAGLYDDTFISGSYYPCISEAIKYATVAVDEANKRSEELPFNKNLYQFARIWRAMVVGQFADNFGPYPLNAAQDGVNPVFNSEKETYDFILNELSQAVKGIDLSIQPSETQASCDHAYGYDPAKWQKLGNSLRMRYAMRLTNTDLASKAQTEFEDACKGGNYIKTIDDMLWFKSDDGWNDFTGPFTRSWNLNALSATLANLMTNLGGVSIAEQRSDLAQYTKPNEYLGIRYNRHFVENTDNPTKQYWLDGIPENLDPRALKMFWLVNDTKAENQILSSDKGTNISDKGAKLLDRNNSGEITIKGDFTWNGLPSGISTSWAETWSFNQLVTTNSGVRSCFPLLGAQYCRGGETGLGKKVFYGAWESYFLIAEAALRGWTTGMTDKAAYEDGVRASFEYFGISEYANAYLASEDYNRIGTSVSYDHTTEPTSFEAKYVDGYNTKAGEQKVTYNYPDASKILYKGHKLNDKLTKIITQKYLAQVPYVVLEAWSDHRRLGLPFFDMIANESTTLTGSDMTEWRNNSWQSGQTWKYYPQRLRYPSSLRDADKTEYDHALQLLGGENTTMTPLLWSMGATK